MTSAQVAALRAVCAGASAGPWTVDARGELVEDGMRRVIAAAGGAGDARFIAEARRWLPLLLAEVERCWAELARREEGARVLVAIVGGLAGLTDGGGTERLA